MPAVQPRRTAPQPPSRRRSPVALHPKPLFPGETVEDTRKTLVQVVGDPAVRIEATAPDAPLAVPPPMDTKVIGPMTRIAAKRFPGVALVPIVAAGASDAVHFGQIGMPIYGVPGIFSVSDGGGAHGLNERVPVASLYDARDYLFELVSAYIGAW